MVRSYYQIKLVVSVTDYLLIQPHSLALFVLNFSLFSILLDKMYPRLQKISFYPNVKQKIELTKKN